MVHCLSCAVNGRHGSSRMILFNLTSTICPAYGLEIKVDTQRAPFCPAVVKSCSFYEHQNVSTLIPTPKSPEPTTKRAQDCLQFVIHRFVSLKRCPEKRGGLRSCSHPSSRKNNHGCGSSTLPSSQITCELTCLGSTEFVLRHAGPMRPSHIQADEQRVRATKKKEITAFGPNNQLA